MVWALRLALVGALVLGTTGSAGAGTGGSEPRDLLPDLVVRAPTAVAVKTVGKQHRLVFESAAANVGEGPLDVRASRPNTRRPAMTAAQLVSRSDGSTRRHERVGTLRYVISSDHQHWHYLRFMRYSLRREAGGRTVVRDRKTGFCLGDRYDTGRSLPNKPRTAMYRGGCGFRQRSWLTVKEGISVGYGDNYRAELEGQYLLLNGLPAGRYRLVHTVNEDGRLREATRANNSSWVAVRLSWERGRPRIRLGAKCGEDACSLPLPR